MFKCTGICSTCGKCLNSAIMNTANDRKTKLLIFPSDFVPDKDSPNVEYGVAFDIGTTTVVGMLWDFEKGKLLSMCAKTNPQNKFGFDVISRITFCGESEKNLTVLQNEIISCLNEAVEELADTAKIKKDVIKKAYICGNTTMSHIFAGYSPVTLAKVPFHPTYTGVLSLHAKDVMLNIYEKGEIIVTPNIAGHVGGDITAGLLATRFLEQAGLTAFIDIGTNGEIALTDGERYMACSTAAGPAFEGSAIEFGMRAAAGAIEKVIIEEDVFFKTIGECEPQGICGSGIIDIVAQMLKANLINRKGRLISAADAEKLKIPLELRNRLIETDGSRKFIIAYKTDGANIVITQNDIREIQLAKAAIATGLKLMLKELGRTVFDLDRVIIAGAFGNYIDKKSAMLIGLLPDIEEDKLVSAGNTAGAGVSMALVSEKEAMRLVEIPQKIQHLELAADQEFQKVYLSEMAFY